MKGNIARVSLFLALPFAIFFMSGCPGSGLTSVVTGDAAKLVASWRILSETIYYDAGGSQVIQPVTTLLELSASGTWQFGSSTGTWAVATITNADWTTWGIVAYGPTQKIVLTNWSGGTANGPIEESGGNVDFLWVIYGTTSDLFGAGTVWLKFGKN